MRSGVLLVVMLSVALSGVSRVVSAQAGSEGRGQYERGSFIDSRDGHEYGWISVGDRVWMSENLTVEVEGPWWFYDNDGIRYEGEFGRLYSWEAARTACPAGWHLPTEEEWRELVTEIGGAGAAGDWFLDPSGFAAPLGGVRRYEEGGSFEGLRENGAFWADTPHFDDHAKYAAFFRGQSRIVFYGYHRDAGHSVRCVRDG